MSTQPPDPYAVLGIEPGAGAAEITAAYRRAVRACHPDAPHPDRDRFAIVLAAYQQLRDRDTPQPAEQHQHAAHGHDIPVRVHPHPTPSANAADLRAGPVRRHPRRR